MKQKQFDRVEMKRRGALEIYEALKDLSVEEQIAYWEQRNDEFRKWYKELLNTESQKPPM